MKIFISSLDAIPKFAELLPASMREVAASFSEKRRCTYLTGRAILNKALREFYGIDSYPLEQKDLSGKPFFMESRYPFFNITHSKSYICLALSDYEVGVDIEGPKDKDSKNFDAIAKRVLCEDELKRLLSLDRSKQVEMFASLWTVRESLIKLSGRGLVDIRSISVDLQNDRVSYFLAPKSQEICTFSIKDMTNLTSEFYLSCNVKANDSFEFYTLQSNEFVRVDTPTTLRRLRIV